MKTVEEASAREKESGCVRRKVRAARIARLLATLALVGTGMAVYFTLRSDPRFVTAGFVPHSIAHWADDNGQFRNFPAYVLLTGVLMMAWRNRTWNATVRPVRMVEGRRFNTARLIEGIVAFRPWQIAALLLVFSAVLEFVQLGISTRWFEWADIWWSWAGVLCGWWLWEAVMYGVMWWRGRSGVSE